MSATDPIVRLMSELSDDELFLLQRAIHDQLAARARGARPAEGDDILDLLNWNGPPAKKDPAARLRRTTVPGKPRLRAVRADERPTRTQWNEATQSWG